LLLLRLLWCMQINDALKDLMPEIHALSIKRCWTKAQQAANTQQAAATAGTSS
jgi:acid stress-induced BolA-like protein IbaG/YrbA